MQGLKTSCWVIAAAPVGEKLALLRAPGESALNTGGQKIQKSGSPAANPKSIPPSARVEKATSAVPSGRVQASPLAKKIAAARHMNLATVQGSGTGGRIIARDVESIPAATAPKLAATTPAMPAIPGDRRIPLTGMRKIIAERLLTSKTQIPHFYLDIEVDAGEVVRLRAQLNKHWEKSGQSKLTFNDFVLKAAIMAAARVPRVNASFDGDAVIEFADIHLSVAVAIEDGLVTPVIRQGQKKSLREISEAAKDFAARARTKNLKPEEYQGGTITVSNLGSYGIDHFSAVINPPQAMILAVGAIVKKPVLNAQEQIVFGHRLAIGLSADHRVVDGAVGAQYLAELRQLLENPAWMLL